MFAALAGGMLVAGSPSWAQNVAGPGPSPDAVVVTAVRIEQNRLDIGQSVERVTEDAIEFVAPLHPAELLNTVSGVGIQQGSGQEHLTAIRSPVLTGGAGAGSFLYLEDGVPTRAAGFGNVNGLFELGTEFAAAVEVTKGPGSVLYGSNAQHGLVNVLSRAPDGPSRARFVAGGEQVSGWASVARGNTRLSLSLSHDSGFRDDSGFDQQKLQWRQDGELGVWGVSALTSVQNLNQETAGFLQAGPDAFREGDLARRNAFPEAYRDAWSARTQARFERAVGASTLALTPYARVTEIEFLRHFVPGQAREEQEHASVGFLATLYRDPFVVGVDAELTEGSLFEFQDNPTRFSFVEGLHYDYDVRSLVLSPYVQAEWALGPRTTLLSGVRLDYTDYAYSNRADTGRSGRFVRLADRGDDFVTVTPKVELVHRPGDGLSVYLRGARGARAPQTSDLYSLQTNQVEDGRRVGSFDPETLDLAEAGAASLWRWGGRTWQGNAVLYYMEKRNFFFRNADGFNVTDGQTRHVGLEASVSGDVFDWLSVSASGSVAEHTYRFDDPASGIVSGLEVDTAPTTLARVGIDVRPSRALSVGADLRHVGSYFTNPSNTRDYGGHEVVDARARLAVGDGLALFVRLENAFDTNYADRADFAFGNDRYFPGRPRRVLVGLDVRWD